MSSETQFGNVTKGYGVVNPRGQIAVMSDASAVRSHKGWACQEVGMSGAGGDPLFGIADLTNALVTQTIIPASEARRGLRPYLKRLDMRVLGTSQWTSASAGAGIYFGDTNQNPIAYYPINALRPEAFVTFPTADTEFNMYLGNGQTITLSSYSGGVATFSATAFVAGALVGTPVQIIAGTGQWATGIITANAAATLTVSFQGGSVVPDATSVFKLPYWAASAGGASTFTIAPAAGLPASNGLDNGFALVLVSGTGVGGVRLCQTNSSTVATTSQAWNTQPASGTLGQFTNNPEVNGAIDLGIDSGRPVLALNTGLMAWTQGTISGGSPVSFYYELWWGQ